MQSISILFEKGVQGMKEEVLVLVASSAKKVLKPKLLNLLDEALTAEIRELLHLPSEEVSLAVIELFYSRGFEDLQVGLSGASRDLPDEEKKRLENAVRSVLADWDMADITVSVS